MRTTIPGDAPSETHDGPRLRVDVCDQLAKKLGITTVEGQAELFGIHRSHIFRMRGGYRISSLENAMNMAHKLGTTVEHLFEWPGEGK